MGETGKDSSGGLDESQKKKDVIDEARTKGVKSSFSLDGHLSFGECRIGNKAPKNTKVELHFEATL